MQPKETLLVVVGGILLTNISIFGTLLLTGHFDGDAEEQLLAEAAAEAPSAGEPSPDGAPAPEPELPKSRIGYLHSVADAMYICEEKLQSSSAEFKSYSFDHHASFYNEAEDVFHIFIESQKVSRAGAPSELADIICDVSAESKTVVNYKAVNK